MFAGAQQPPKPHLSPAPRLLILPPTVVAEAPATLAVLDSQGRLLPNIMVALSDGQKVTTDVTGRAMFRGADRPGIQVATIPSLGVTASAAVEAPMAPASHEARKAVVGGVRVVSYPHVLAIHDRFTLDGSGFRGVADSNHVYLNGDPCLVLAASPASLVVLPGPGAPVGDVNLRLVVEGMDAVQFPVSAVLLEFSGPAEAADAGTTGKLVLHVHGTTERLLVEVRNGSPGVIRLAKGNVQRVKTSGGEENTAAVEVEFMAGGNYQVSARLVSESPGAPDLESAKRRLVEARKIASGNWPARINSVLLKFNQRPQDLPQIRAELQSMLGDKPAPDVASLLGSVWRELN